LATYIDYISFESRAAELVGRGKPGKPGRERTFEVKYVKSGEYGSVPFHAALWGPRQQIGAYL